MKYNVGDKVRFLNAEGGGHVSRVTSSLVYVEDEDGFEIPVVPGELVLIEAAAKQKAAEEQQRIEEKRNEVPEIMVDSTYTFAEDQSDDHAPQFLLAFIKSDRGNSGYLDLYAVNDSNHFAFFTLTEVADGNNVRMLHYGTIEPNTKLELGRYNPQHIDNQTWQCQLLLFKKSKTFASFPPTNTSLKIKSAKFFRDNSFVQNDFFAEKAVTYSVIQSKLEASVANIDGAEIAAAMMEKQPKGEPKRQSKRVVNGIIEVDLHIDEILDSTAGLSAGEMLQVQLARFRHVMEENIGHKGQRVVFIHGVGTGVLKTELRKILDRDYRKINYQDASFKEYGFGATMVIF